MFIQAYHDTCAKDFTIYKTWTYFVLSITWELEETSAIYMSLNEMTHTPFPGLNQTEI